MTTTPPVLANGDTNYMYAESLLQLSMPLPPESDTGIDQQDVDLIADHVNAEVNLMLAELGFTFPLDLANENAIKWIRWTKTLKTAGYTLLGLAGQSGDDALTDRASQILEDFSGRMQKLEETNGDFLKLPTDETGRASQVPVALSVTTSQDVLKGIVRRKLRFEQLVRVERYENEQFVNDYAPSEWLPFIRGV
jgi:hypothetical protein